MITSPLLCKVAQNKPYAIIYINKYSELCFQLFVIRRRPLAQVGLGQVLSIFVINWVKFTYNHTNNDIFRLHRSVA